MCYVDTEGFSGRCDGEKDEIITTIPVFGPGFEITFELQVYSAPTTEWAFILSIRYTYVGLCISLAIINKFHVKDGACKRLFQRK